jgi:outer membrane protein
MKPIKPFNPTTPIPWSRVILASILILSVYSAVVGTIWLAGGSSKVAYVNSASLLQKYKGAIEANRTLEEESKKWGDNIQTLQAELDSLNFLFANQSESWSLTRKKDVATYARKREQDLNRYSQAVQQKAAARQQELLAPVLAEINNAVADYAREKGYAMVLGTIDGNIVYADNAVDITDAVLEKLNR